MNTLTIDHHIHHVIAIVWAGHRFSRQLYPRKRDPLIVSSPCDTFFLLFFFLLLLLLLFSPFLVLCVYPLPSLITLLDELLVNSLSETQIHHGRSWWSVFCSSAGGRRKVNERKWKRKSREEEAAAVAAAFDLHKSQVIVCLDRNGTARFIHVLNAASCRCHECLSSTALDFFSPLLLSPSLLS